MSPHTHGRNPRQVAQAMVDRSVVPTEDEARALGCTCTWWDGSIVSPEADCPFSDRHFSIRATPASNAVHLHPNGDGKSE